MITAIVFDRDRKERELIGSDCIEQVARMSDEPLSLETVSDCGAIVEAVEQEKLVDLLYYDFCRGQSLDELIAFRNRYKNSMVMIITESSVSPLEYLRPGVSPDSLMLRPVELEKLNRTNNEFIGNFLQRFKRKESEESFLVNTRDEKLYIPYPYIYYFEARDKKLFVRTKHEEYAFYDTIESLIKNLPDQFIRCHRSYIVNRQKILRIVPAKNFIELTEKMGVPMSRSYKAVLMGRKP